MKRIFFRFVFVLDAQRWRGGVHAALGGKRGTNVLQPGCSASCKDALRGCVTAFVWEMMADEIIGANWN